MTNFKPRHYEDKIISHRLSTNCQQKKPSGSRINCQIYLKNKITFYHLVKKDSNNFNLTI